jgi:uncharacterized protein YbaP (TraB family)
MSSRPENVMANRATSSLRHRFRTLRRTLPGLSIALGVLSALGIVGCASEPDSNASRPRSSDASYDQTLASTPATPLFFRIDGGHGATLLLLGTIHLGPETGWNFSEALQDGLEHADSFILELDLDKVDEEDVATSLAELVVISSPQTLQDLVSPETAKVLADNDALLSELGLPVNARKRLKPWYIAMSLIESTTKRSGLSTLASAESVIQASIGSRPLLGLETYDEQLSLLNDIDPALQDLMLRDTLSRLDEAVEETRALALAWHSGDEATLEALAREGVDEIPELENFYKIILGDRNRRWMTTFRSLLDDPERRNEFVFVGVGALHLLLEDGLLDLFQQSGYRVTAIDHTSRIEVREQ